MSVFDYIKDKVEYHEHQILRSIAESDRNGLRPRNVPCDLAGPGATQNELDGNDARTLAANGKSTPFSRVTRTS